MRSSFSAPVILFAIACVLSIGSSAARGAPDAAALIERARFLEAELERNPSRLKLRHHIERVIRAWEDAKREARGDERALALDGELRSREILAHWSGHPKDRARMTALAESRSKPPEQKPLTQKPPVRKPLEQKSPEQKPQARKPVERMPPEKRPVLKTPEQKAIGRALVSGVAVRTEGPAVEVRISVDKPVSAKRHLIPSKEGAGARVYCDISPASVKKGLSGDVSVEHEDLASVRVAQFDPDTVRIVVNVSAGRTAPDPIIFLARGFESEEAPVSEGEPSQKEVLAEIVAELRKAYPEVAGDLKVDEAEPAAALAPDSVVTPDDYVAPEPKPPRVIRRVVIDPGHGGKDHGARGVGGVLEKDINLAIAKKLGSELERRLQVKVIYTRTRDVFVSLRRRAKIANGSEGDLLVSVHSNAHRRASVHGVETYYLDVSSNRYATRLAEHENQGHENQGHVGAGVDDSDAVAAQEDQVALTGDLSHDLRFILADMAMRSATVESKKLAVYVQRALVGKLEVDGLPVRDLGVKHALFYVLLGARMPAILVETGFLTNHREGRRLASARYQERVADAMASAVARFADHRVSLAGRDETQGKETQGKEDPRIRWLASARPRAAH